MKDQLYLLARDLVQWCRRKHYRLTQVHPTCLISGPSILSRDLIAREHTFIAMGCWIGPGVELEAYVMLGPRVAVVGADHRYNVPGTPIMFSGREPLPKTVIERDAWVGYGAIILAGNRVGRGAIVAAGAVVTRDVAPYTIVAGVPAKPIGKRFPSADDAAKHEAFLNGPVLPDSWNRKILRRRESQ